jgi:DNA-binding NarL/FixJ family response regulator
VKTPDTDKTNSPSPPIKVVLADDHALVRAGIRALLERIGGVEVIGEAGDGREALELVSALKPDILLLDITMPVLNGLEVLRESRKDFPQVCVIVLTVHETEEYAVHALRSGASGFLPKSAASAELELALQTVMSGGQYVSPGISKKAASEIPAASGARAAPAELTPRQLEVLKMIAKGHSTKDIANTLDISAKTVETHRAQLMERLQIYDVAGLVRYAIRTGLVMMDD